MKIYVASSWRTPRHAEVVDRLRREGYEVYDYREANQAFAWDHIAPGPETWPAAMCIDALDVPEAREAFLRDYAALAVADVVVGVQPFGASAGMEVGFAVGAGKPTFLLVADGCPELMSGMLTFRAATVDEIISRLNGLRAVKCGELPTALENYTAVNLSLRLEHRYEAFETPEYIYPMAFDVYSLSGEIYGREAREASHAFARLAMIYTRQFKGEAESKPEDR